MIFDIAAYNKINYSIITFFNEILQSWLNNISLLYSQVKIVLRKKIAFRETLKRLNVTMR